MDPEVAKAMRQIVKEEMALGLKTYIATVNASLAKMQTDIDTCKSTCDGLETGANAADTRITELERENEILKKEVIKLNGNVASVADHSRKFNIKIMGLPKGVEGPKPTPFVSDMLYEIFGEEELGDPPLVNIAHRIGPQTQQRRTMIVRLNSLEARNTIIKLAAVKGKQGSLRYREQKISIYPDLTTEQREQIAAFNEVRELLRTTDLRHGIAQPKIKLLVTFKEETHTFTDPAKAKVFFENEIKPTLS